MTINHKFFMDAKLVKFLLVGLIGNGIALTIVWFNTEILGIYYLINVVIGFIVGTLFNFFANKLFTFKDFKSTLQLIEEIFRYYYSTSLALVINVVLTYVLTDIVGIYYLFSTVIAIGLSSLINFTVVKLKIFNQEVENN